jgi:hypothetical protein
MYNWKQAFKQKNFRIKFILSFIVLGLLMTWLGTFFNYVEARQGHIFYDPFLNFLRPTDVSDFIFYTTYGSALVGLIYAFRSPYLTLHLCQMYVLLNVFRVACMFFLPLDPPAGIIPLKDVILEKTVYEGSINLKDLFFSGHTAILFLFFFFVKNAWLKLFFFVSGTAVAFGLMLQHVHYSFDIIAAPFFAFLSWKIVVRYFKLYHKGTEALA